MRQRPRLVVMLKEPHPGRVKTRLARDIGPTAAAWWFRHQTKRMLRRLQDPRWLLVLAVSPDCEGLTSRVWPGHLPRIGQGRGDLGARMARIFAQLRGAPACIIGSDIPGIERRPIARAFHALGRADAVFGPSPDGGYWLIGLNARRAPPPGLFHRVRWSSGTALADTRASIPDLSTALIDTLRDVDCADDLLMTCPAARATSRT